MVSLLEIQPLAVLCSCGSQTLGLLCCGNPPHCRRGKSKRISLPLSIYTRSFLVQRAFLEQGFSSHDSSFAVEIWILNPSRGMTQNLKDKPEKRVCVDFPSIFTNLRLMVTFDWFGIPGSCLGKCGSLKSMPPMDFFSPAGYRLIGSPRRSRSKPNWLPCRGENLAVGGFCCYRSLLCTLQNGERFLMTPYCYRDHMPEQEPLL